MVRLFVTNHAWEFPSTSLADPVKWRRDRYDRAGEGEWKPAAPRSLFELAANPT
jgi:hypothetical protein